MLEASHGDHKPNESWWLNPHDYGQAHDLAVLSSPLFTASSGSACGSH